jgi:hypothetical protein
MNPMNLTNLTSSPPRGAKIAASPILASIPETRQQRLLLDVDSSSSKSSLTSAMTQGQDPQTAKSTAVLTTGLVLLLTAPSHSLPCVFSSDSSQHLTLPGFVRRH